MPDLNTYYHEDYSGGLNDTAASEEINRNEAALLRNWEITYKGRLKRRDGLVQTGDTMTDAIDGLHGYIRPGVGKDLLLAEGGSLRYLNSTTWAELDSGFTSGTTLAFEDCPINARVYMGSETDTQHHWDRASTTKDSCLTDLGAAVPHGNVYVWHKNFMFTLNAANVSGTKYYNRFYWSAFGDPDSWDTTNDYITLSGGGKMVTAGDLGDSLVIFKERGIYFLSGWGDTDWRVTATASNVASMSEAVGCLSPRGIVRVGNELWFMDDEGNIRRLFQTDFDAFRQDVICNKVKTTLAGLNKAQLAKVEAWSWNDKVYFAFPTGSNSTNDTVLVYDLTAHNRTGEEAWTTITGWSPKFAITYPTSAAVDLYIANNSKKVHKHTGDDDDGVAIDARWDGKKDDFDKSERNKVYYMGYIRGEASNDIDVEVHASVDNGGFAKLTDLNLTAAGGTLGPSGTFALGPTGTTAILGGTGVNEQRFIYTAGGGTNIGKTIQHSIRHSTINEQPVVRGFSSHYRVRSLI